MKLRPPTFVDQYISRKQHPPKQAGNSNDGPDDGGSPDDAPPAGEREKRAAEIRAARLRKGDRGHH